MGAPEKLENSKLNRRAAIFSISVSSTLFIVKTMVGLLSNSIAVMASALDSAFDFLSSSVNYYAIKHAQKPADAAHRYGHGKLEALAGFVQSIIIFASAFYLIYRAADRLIYPQEVERINESIAIMTLSVILTWALVAYQSYVHKKSQNMVIAADRLHYVTDLLANGAVIVSLLLGQYVRLPFFDAITALGISIFVIKGSSEIFKQSFDILMDKDISDKYRDDIIDSISKVSPDILGYHDLRSRSAGDVDFLEFHLEIPKNLTVKAGHDMVERLMHEMQSRHPNLEIIIHTDPAELDEKDGQVKIFDRDTPRFY